MGIPLHNTAAYCIIHLQLVRAPIQEPHTIKAAAVFLAIYRINDVMSSLLQSRGVPRLIQCCTEQLGRRIQPDLEGRGGEGRGAK